MPGAGLARHLMSMGLMTVQISLGEIVEAFYEELLETYGDHEVALMMAQTLANELMLAGSHGEATALLGATAGAEARSSSGPGAAGDARSHGRRAAAARRLAAAARALSPGWKAGRHLRAARRSLVNCG